VPPLGGPYREAVVTKASLKGLATSRHQHIRFGGARMLLLLAIGIVGAIANSSAARATVLTATGPSLWYINTSPSALFGAGSERILFAGDSVIPNGSGLGGFPATTGFATTTNLSTGDTITHAIGFDPSPISPNFFAGSTACTMACTPSGNNNPINLTGPWTITFQNPGTAPTSVSNILSLAGPGEIPFVSSITFSGTSTQPTFSWNPPAGIAPDGYRIQIYQNNLTTPMDNQAGEVVFKNLPPTTTSYTVQPSDFTVPGDQLLPSTTYNRNFGSNDEKWVYCQSQQSEFKRFFYSVFECSDIIWRTTDQFARGDVSRQPSNIGL
jgi:hypothetical protein